MFDIQYSGDPGENPPPYFVKKIRKGKPNTFLFYTIFIPTSPFTHLPRFYFTSPPPLGAICYILIFLLTNFLSWKNAKHFQIPIDQK